MFICHPLVSIQFAQVIGPPRKTIRVFDDTQANIAWLVQALKAGYRTRGATGGKRAMGMALGDDSASFCSAVMVSGPASCLQTVASILIAHRHQHQDLVVAASAPHIKLARLGPR